MRWCIVIADDRGPEWAAGSPAERQPTPVQYVRLGDSSTLLQKALQRASKISPAAQIAVTALEEHREYWEPSLWFIPTANRFVCDDRTSSVLTTAAALLSIAGKAPSSIVTVLPARCYVEHEWILDAALDRALTMLPEVPEGVVTLGMMDIAEGVDEDYLVACRAQSGPGFTIQGFARRPIPWIARHLRQRGAMTSSGIMIGYAAAFAAHISKQWPGLTRSLTDLYTTASAAGAECEIPLDLQKGVPKPVLRSLRWHPPSFSQRAFRVYRCGWSSLKSPQAVNRIRSFLSQLHEAGG